MKWIISFADACSCGDGAIYRASNFILTGIKENEALCLLPDGTKIHKLTLKRTRWPRARSRAGALFFDVTDGNFSWGRYMEAGGVLPSLSAPLYLFH